MELIKTVPLEEEFKRNPELKSEDIQILREWCSKQPHLPAITDSQLALFLHSNYFRIEPTKITIDNFFTIRTHMPEIFHNRDPLGSKELRQAFTVGCCFPLEMKTKEGYAIFYSRLLDTNPANYTFNDTTKHFCMMSDLYGTMQGTIPGYTVVVDVEGVTFGHATRLNPMALKKFIYYVQEGIPIRLKNVHYINVVPAMEMIMNMMKPFLKKELMELIHIHSSLKSLEKFIPLEALPNEIGGKAGTIEDLASAEVKLLEEHRSWFLAEQESARVNEALRPGKSKSDADLFGVEGTFKKLEID